MQKNIMAGISLLSAIYLPVSLNWSNATVRYITKTLTVSSSGAAGRQAEI
jgi:hypothetical protein